MHTVRHRATDAFPKSDENKIFTFNRVEVTPKIQFGRNPLR